MQVRTSALWSMLIAGLALAGWFATRSTQALAVADLEVKIREWDVPTKGAHPHDPAVAPDGSLWFTEQMVFDMQGTLWFTVQVGNMVGRLDPKTGKIELKLVPTKEARPYGIQINSKGEPFFCEFGTNKMAKIDPKTMQITEYPLPQGARPRRLAIAANDQVYLTDYQGGNLGRLDPVSSAFRMWSSPGGAGSDPYGIAITPDGVVWYSESGVTPNALIRFNPKTEEFARTKIPSGGGTVRNMVATSDGRIYLACSGVNKVGVVEPIR